MQKISSNFVKSPFWFINLIIFLLPTYLVRFKIFGFPTNLLEVMIGVLVLMRIIRGIRRNYEDYEEQKNHKGYKGFNGFNDHQLLFVGIILLILGATISTIFSIDKITSAGILKSWIFLPVLFFLIIIDKDTEILRGVYNERKRIGQNDNKFLKIYSILKSFVLSGFAVALISIFYLIQKNLTYDGRLKAFFLHPNHLAMYLAPAWLMAYSLWLMTKKSLEKTLWLFIVLVISFSLYFTYSYGAWIGIIGGIIFIWGNKNEDTRNKGDKWGKWERKKYFNFRTLISLLVLLSLLTLIVLLQFHSPKLQNILTSERSSFHSRLMVWHSAIHILKDHWLLGIGPGMFQKYYLNYQQFFPPYLEWAAPQPHNLFLAFWLQTGIMGLIGFIMILVWFYKKGIQGIRGLKGINGDKKNASQIYVRLILMSIMTYILIHGLIDTPYWKNDLSMIFWIIIGAQRLKGLKGINEIKEKN